MTKTPTLKNPRLFYLDWLRVLAFGILIVANCAEVFTGDGWIDNTETNQTIADVLLFFRQWRMPLLFIISGVAISLMLQKKSIFQFIDDRLTRIMGPLISGMLLVVPPMIFFIWRGEGNTISIQDFYLGLLNLEWFPRGNFHWLHLWYLAFIFIFSLAVLPLIMFFRSEKAKPFIQDLSLYISRKEVLFPLVLIFHFPYFISNIFIPNTDLSSLIYYFPYFLFGVVFVTHPQIRQTFFQNRNTALCAGLISTALLYYFIWLEKPAGLTLAPVLDELARGPLRLWLLSLNQWFWVIALSGFAIRYLDFGNKFLSYANRVVYSFYILHQTVIIIIAYFLLPLDASIFIKFCIILIGTLLTVLAVYELLLKRLKILKLMFGIKTDLQLMETFPRLADYIKKLLPQLSRVANNPLNPG